MTQEVAGSSVSIVLKSVLQFTIDAAYDQKAVFDMVSLCTVQGTSTSVFFCLTHVKQLVFQVQKIQPFLRILTAFSVPYCSYYGLRSWHGNLSCANVLHCQCPVGVESFVKSVRPILCLMVYYTVKTCLWFRAASDRDLAIYACIVTGTQTSPVQECLYLPRIMMCMCMCVRVCVCAVCTVMFTKVRAGNSTVTVHCITQSGERLVKHLQVVDRNNILWSNLKNFFKNLQCCKRFLTQKHLAGQCERCTLHGGGKEATSERDTSFSSVDDCSFCC